MAGLMLRGGLHRTRVGEDEEEETRKKEKIARYESFVEERLKKDLQRVLEERKKVLEEVKVYDSLARSVRMLDSYGRSADSLHTLVNIGSDVLAHAHVPDTRKVVVKVGLGFYVEFERFEALAFIDTKVEQLHSRRVEELSGNASSIKAHIKLVLEGIKELMNIKDLEGGGADDHE